MVYFIHRLFYRSDNDTVGNGWLETESGSGNAKISSNRLVFDTLDDLNVPVVVHTFSPQTSGLLNWTFIFNFERTGAEGTYEFWMQLGNNATFVSPATSDNTGVAVNLKWAGTNRGMNNDEGFGYVQGLPRDPGEKSPHRQDSPVGISQGRSLSVI